MTNERFRVTYGELLHQVEALRPLFAEKKKDGQNILILLALPGGPHFTAVQLAAFAEHAVVVPVPNKSTAYETHSYLRLIQPDIVVVESPEECRQILNALARPVTILSLKEVTGKNEGTRILNWEDIMNAGPGMTEPVPPGNSKFPAETALIHFTSGSAGSPKGILLSNANLLACLNNNHAFLSSFAGEDVFCPVPQFHAFGGAVVLEHLLNGSPVHLSNHFLPGDDLARMQQYGCTAILAAPSYFKLLLELNMLSPELLPALVSVTIGTAPADQGLVRDMQKKVPDLRIYLRYGLTETVGTVTRLTIEPGESLSFSGLVGSPVSGVELGQELTPPDQGEPLEIRVRSRVVAVGQLLKKDHWKSLTDSYGFFSTGDLGHLDTKGRLHLRGRISSFLKRNGFRINPFEIETLLRNIPGIREAVVLGIEDAFSGQQIIACVETAPDAHAPDLKQLRNICAANLSAYKLPQRIVIMDTIPEPPRESPTAPAQVNAYLITGDDGHFSFTTIIDFCSGKLLITWSSSLAMSW